MKLTPHYYVMLGLRSFERADEAEHADIDGDVDDNADEDEDEDGDQDGDEVGDSNDNSREGTFDDAYEAADDGQAQLHARRNPELYVRLPSGGYMHKATLVRLINSNIDMLTDEEGGALSVERLRRVMSGRRSAAEIGIAAGTRDGADGSVGIGSNVAWAGEDGRSRYGRVVSMVKLQTAENGNKKRVKWQYPVPLTAENRPKELTLQVSTFRHTHQASGMTCNLTAHKAATKLQYDGPDEDVQFCDVVATGELQHTEGRMWDIEVGFRKQVNSAIVASAVAGRGGN